MSDKGSYSPEKTAFVIIDPFNDFLSDGGKLYPITRDTVERVKVIPNLKKLLDGSRTAGIRVFYAQHRRYQPGDFDNWKFPNPSHRSIHERHTFAKGSWGGEFHSELQPKPGDILASEHWTSSGFANTDLHFLLQKYGIDHIVLGGMIANTCVESTARYGVELGYHVTLITDGIGAFSEEGLQSTLKINFPAFGHAMLSTDEFVASIEK